MRIKEVNKKIPEKREDSNDRFRVIFEDKSRFDLLVVNICRLKTGEVVTFEFKSAELPDKDSIHFATSIESRKFKVYWHGVSNTPDNYNTKNKKKYVQTYTKEITSFPPIVGSKPTLLILGTMPGKDSLRLNEYYANTRNNFWKIIFTLHDKEIESSYISKVDFLKQVRISIWDVCHTANRKTSLDSDIKNEAPNNIEEFLKTNSTIKMIAFNGQKAEKLYDKYFKRFEGINYVTLLSTSPANTSYSFEEKIDDWSRIIKV